MISSLHRVLPLQIMKAEGKTPLPSMLPAAGMFSTEIKVLSVKRSYLGKIWSQGEDSWIVANLLVEHAALSQLSYIPCVHRFPLEVR